MEEYDSTSRETSLYFVFFSALLVLIIILSKELHKHPRFNSIFSEAALILVVGMAAGFFVDFFILPNDQDLSDDDYEEKDYVVAHSLLSFDPNIFFMALLPPILFNSGYQLRRELFYRHIKPIVLFACVGTTISALVTAFTLYGVQLLGLTGDFDPTIVELLTFSSLIAATDTVSILAIFQQKRVDPHLFYLVFGESALNDAVALVLFETFASCLSETFTAGSIARRSVLFLVEFLGQAIGSPLLGIIFGFGTALIFKHVDLREHKILELSLFMLLMYIPFIIAELLHLSGIVAIFFGGMSARRYVAPNVSTDTEENAEVIFKLAAYLAETCIFLELGLSVFGLSGSFKWQFIAWAFVAALLGRAFGIYPLSYVYNWSLRELPKDESVESHLDSDGIEQVDSFESVASTASSLSNSPGRKKRKRRTPLKRKDKKISMSMAHVLWFAGLRGAVAYACAREFPAINGHNDEFIAATMVIVVVMIVGMGGATECLLRHLDIEMDVDEDQYMKEWHKQRKLKGAFHRFENDWIFKQVVRVGSEADDKQKIQKELEIVDGSNAESAFMYQSADQEQISLPPQTP